MHGRETGLPRRLGLDVASICAGMLATSGLLAIDLARRRGATMRHLETSVLEAALVMMSHYIAQASSPEGRAQFAAGTSRVPSGPPFPTADKRWVEIETFDAWAWKRFWLELGVAEPLLGPAWRSFCHRYSTAVCWLPSEFRAATAMRTLGELTALAVDCDLAVSSVRGYTDVLDDTALMLIDAQAPDTDSARLSGASDVGAGRVAQSPAAGEMAQLPLEGVTVVEVSSRIQGPLAGQLLRMLGADVTRVEPPGGDFARSAPPLSHGTGAVFLSLNRGKRAVELDLSKPEGRASLYALAADADVFLQNWRPGKAAEWQADWSDLARVNPSLVYCHASAWGSLSDRCPTLGLDYLVQAYTAVGEGLTPLDEAPVPSRVLLADVTGALEAVEGALRGLRERQRRGHGCRVTTSMLAGSMALQAAVLGALRDGREDRRRGGRPVWSALDHPLQTSDGHVVMSVAPRALPAPFHALSRSPGPSQRSWERDVCDWISCQPPDELVAHLRASGIPAARVATDLAQLPLSAAAGPCIEHVGGTFSAARPWRFNT